MRNALRSYFHSLYLSWKTGNMSGAKPRIYSYHRNVVDMAPGARLIADGRVHLATRKTNWPGGCFIKLGRNSTLHFAGRVSIRGNAHIVVNDNATVVIGHGSILQERVWLTARQRIELGPGSYIGMNTLILDSDMHAIKTQGEIVPTTSPVRLEKRVWVGSQSIILKGVTIGSNTVVGAGSLVSRDLPAHVLALGRPAQAKAPVDAWGHFIDHDNQEQEELEAFALVGGYYTGDD